MNPTFSEYANMLDDGQRALVASAFRARGQETGEVELYAALIAGLELAEGADVDIPNLCAGMFHREVAAEKLHWGGKVQEPRTHDPVSQLYCHVCLRFIQAEVRQRGKLRRRAGN